ncbi:unnamed protein product [Ceutorhynchus assimilis]|uniref:F5/8 type C domain-containing protein n=1 Tax=Ceutorhynchus assimilis TaxID=467358 RepID=A0A9N9QR51_9CUCU|nr:unnamed protein product [Ceutorhynchus assimilis]
MRKIRENLAIFFVPLVPLLFADVQSVEPSQCIAPLGMQSGAIKNQDITASSSFDHGNVGPHHGRVRNELNGGAWCPQNQATPETREWIEIDLHIVHMITATEIQGRFGNGQGVEYAEQYVLEYYRPSLNKWVRYRSKVNGHLLKGNVNTYLEEKTILDPPIWASKIRFLPYSAIQRFVCMRVEIYGCKWSDGIESYSMPEGDKRGTNWEFRDFAYDGQRGMILKHGLGQLVDGQTSPDDFRLPFQEISLQNWIGWKNDTRSHQPIEIVFDFDKPREFRTVHLYTNNQFLRDIQVFSCVKIYFSLDGEHYKGDPIVYEYIEDRIFDNARNVTVKLHHRMGKFVKLQLYFAAKWILISEINFESSIIAGNFTEETTEEVIDSKKFNMSENLVTTSNSDHMGVYIGISIGVLLLLVCLVGIMIFVIVQQRKYKNMQRPSQIADKGTLYQPAPLDLINMSSDYADIQDFEYAVPLQDGYASPSDSIAKPSCLSQQYYAEIPDFIPASPTLRMSDSPNPRRYNRSPPGRYMNPIGL